MEKVSVVVPVYNRARLLKRCLDSVYSQTWRPIELIVVDNNSSDGSAELAQKWAVSHSTKDFEIKLLREYNKGAAYARNRGVEAASGEYLMYCDSDDALRPTLIRRAIGLFMEDSETDIVCWKCVIHGFNGGTHIPAFSYRRPIEGHIIHALIHPLGYMARTRVLRKAGDWNESLLQWDDFEYGLRVLLVTDKVVGIDEVLGDVYAQSVSITGEDFSTRIGKWESSLDEMERVIKKSEHQNRDSLLRMVDYRRIILAAHYAREGSMDYAWNLKNATLSAERLTKWQKVLLRGAYAYTRYGLRGAWRLIAPFFR